MPQFNSEPKSSGDGKHFLKLKDKESVTGVLMGNVHEFYTTWKDKKPTEHKEYIAGSRFRFRVNLVTKDPSTGELVSKLFEQGAVVYNHLKALGAEYELEETYIKITRSGSGLNDTEYSILPLLKLQITPEVKLKLKAVLLQSLESEAAPQGSGESHGPNFDPNEEIPF